MLHFPITFYLFGMPFTLHWLMEWLGMFIGFRYYLFLKKQQGDILDEDTRTVLIICAGFSALVGSRLLGGLEKIQELLHAKNVLLYFYFNKTIVGGLLGGLLGVEIAKKVKHIDTPTGDLFTNPLIIALAIGRIGCFSMGIYDETYGIPSDLPWGLKLGDNVARHPVMLYEIIFLTLLFLLIRYAATKYILKEGDKFKIFLIAYLFFRLLIDFLKPKHNILMGLSMIQLACILGLLYYYKYLISPSILIHPKTIPHA